MTPSRLTECLVIIRWTPEILAEALGCDESLVNAWILGHAEVPVKTAAWIHTIATFHEAAEAQKPASLKGRRWRGE